MTTLRLMVLFALAQALCACNVGKSMGLVDPEYDPSKDASFRDFEASNPVRVSQLKPGSEAAKFLQVGDVISAIGGKIQGVELDPIPVWENNVVFILEKFTGAESIVFQFEGRPPVRLPSYNVDESGFRFTPLYQPVGAPAPR
ncbi:MAG: hypothetical protein NUW37_15800 [Planctomycetes bacterium]|nr:hypothetical protein [Planctomycetota bacterium]